MAASILRKFWIQRSIYRNGFYGLQRLQKRIQLEKVTFVLHLGVISSVLLGRAKGERASADRQVFRLWRQMG
jgi:hypothetical protein